MTSEESTYTVDTAVEAASHDEKVGSDLSNADETTPANTVSHYFTSNCSISVNYDSVTSIFKRSVNVC